MSVRKILMGLVTLLLAGAVFASAANALETEPNVTVATLENVRDYAPSVAEGEANYAIDGGVLFAGAPGAWQQLETPEGVIVNAVAVNSQNNDTVYIGAANEMAIYRSENSGESWLRIPLATEAIGGVTDIAVDASNKLVYVGTDTDGLHRLRDVGTSMIASGHLLLDEPVMEVVADSSGMGIAYVRTPWDLYRAEEVGLRWVAVENLPSPATAVAIANTTPPTVFVGTASSGVRMSQDGINWQAANAGLNYTPGSHLTVHELAVDPTQPDVLYTSTSVAFGSTELHTTHVGVLMSDDGATEWQMLAPIEDVAVTDLMPVPGQTGAVFALTENSRSLLALGTAELVEVVATATAPETGLNWLTIVAWVLAGLAAIAFLAIVWMDVNRRQRKGEVEAGTTAVVPVRNNR